MNKPPPPQVFGPTINRFADVMAHDTFLGFKGVQRLANAAGVSTASVSRLLNGKRNPSFLMVARLTNAIEEAFGLKLDPRDLIAENGEFLHQYCCDVVGCKGCLPERALDEFGQTKAAYVGIKKGQWSTSRYPKGYLQHQKEVHG